MKSAFANKWLERAAQQKLTVTQFEHKLNERGYVQATVKRLVRLYKAVLKNK